MCNQKGLQQKQYLYIDRVLSGRYKLNKHLSKLGIRKGTECKFRKEGNERFIHLLSNCCTPCNSRTLHLEACDIAEEELPNLGPSALMHFFKESDWSATCKYSENRRRRIDLSGCRVHSITLMLNTYNGPISVNEKRNN